MSIFSKRPNGYKAGIILLFMGCIFFIVGFSAPSWTKAYSENHQSTMYGIGYGHLYAESPAMGLQFLKVHGYSGLWMYCFQTGDKHMQCESLGGKVLGWFMAVRGLQSLALIGLLASCCYAIVLNWMQVNPAYNRLVEIVAGCSGLLGFIGTIEYLVKCSSTNFKNMFWDDHAHYSVRSLDFSRGHVSWAFAINMCGCVLSFLASIIIAVNNNSLQSQVTPDSGCQVRSVYINQDHERHTHTPYNAAPRPVTPATSVQVYYMPHNLPPAAEIRPPAYDSYYTPAAPPSVVLADSRPIQTQTPPIPTTDLTIGGSESMPESSTPAPPSVEQKTPPPPGI